MQRRRCAVFPPGEAREDWTILRALSEVLGKRLPLRQRSASCAGAWSRSARASQRLDAVEPAAWGEFGKAGAVDAAPFAPPIANFYLTDPISRASETMAECTEAFVRRAAGEDGHPWLSFWSTATSGRRSSPSSTILAIVVPLLLASPISPMPSAR